VIHSENLNLDFNVHIQGDRTNDTQQKCYIMTVHDLGCDCNKMRILFKVFNRINKQ